MKNKSFLVLAAVLVIGFGMWFLGTRNSSSTSTSPASTTTATTATEKKPTAVNYGKSISSVLFICSQNKRIGANFLERGVNLNLSDGRQLTLPQARSGSGARYANTNESFVFWNKGNTAFITENGTNTFDGCVEGVAE